jgi:DNA/RNA-binding domain of Phe-tRNA-synthetase-like protein
MELNVDPKVFSKFDLNVGIIVAVDMDNKTRVKEAKHLISEIEELIRLTFHKNSVKNHHFISPWDLARKEFPKAKKYHTSVEKLVHKVLKKQSVSTKDVLTMVLNYLSLKYVIPIGSDDVDKVKGGLMFSMGRTELNYRDNKGVLGRKLDYYKATRTKVTPKTSAAVIHIEAIKPFSRRQLNSVLKEAQQLIQSFCGGRTESYVLDKNTVSIRV